jgi:hypothetical protein
MNKKNHSDNLVQNITLIILLLLCGLISAFA